MAFTDPQTITIATVPITLPRTNVGSNSSEYRSSDDLVKLSASSAYGRRNRRVLRVDHAKVSPDAFVPATNSRVSMSCYIVIDEPPTGYTNTEVMDVYTGFNTLVTASSHALITKLIGGES